jgi:group II intron reverse transcriptase/maturase
VETPEGKMTGAQNPEGIATGLRRVAEKAKSEPQFVFTSLAHHIDIELLQEAYRRTRKDGATGVDGQSGADYGAKLEENLQSLLDRFKAKTYRAPPVRRVYIPKGDDKTRPLGIPTFEDKVLQRAVAMVLEAVYEQDFLECSYGFRPGRSAHQAIHSLGKWLMKNHGGTVLDVDIRSFFDTLDHGQLRTILDRRVRDGVIRRTIDQWLRAGVLEGGVETRPRTGTPQGGVISPLLANIYLHEVIDVWFASQVKPRLQGEAILVRYADDMVLAFAQDEDAQRVLAVLPKRLARYGLELHPEKTRVVCFKRPAPWDDDPPHGRSFDLLGFTHYWGKSRRGIWILKHKTSRVRFDRALQRLRQWCKRYRHVPVRDQHTRLSAMLRGHYGYYGVTGNIAALQRFAWEAGRAWRHWLDRRSQKAKMTWEKFNRLLARYPLPQPYLPHSIYARSKATC